MDLDLMEDEYRNGRRWIVPANAVALIERLRAAERVIEAKRRYETWSLPYQRKQWELACSEWQAAKVAGDFGNKDAV